MPRSLIERSNGEETVADELRRRLKRLLWATIILYGVVIIVSAVGWWITHQQTNQTHNALCTFKDDLQKRIDGTQAFLVRYPNGLDGLSKADLVKSIRDQKSTIESLDSLNC